MAERDELLPLLRKRTYVVENFSFGSISRDRLIERFRKGSGTGFLIEDLIATIYPNVVPAKLSNAAYDLVQDGTKYWEVKTFSTHEISFVPSSIRGTTYKSEMNHILNHRNHREGLRSGARSKELIEADELAIAQSVEKIKKNIDKFAARLKTLTGYIVVDLSKFPLLTLYTLPPQALTDWSPIKDISPLPIIPISAFKQKFD